MAYDKKYMGDEEVVKEYLDGREDRIGSEFQLLNNGLSKITSKDGVMVIGDYVIETGRFYSPDVYDSVTVNLSYNSTGEKNVVLSNNRAETSKFLLNVFGLTDEGKFYVRYRNDSGVVVNSQMFNFSYIVMYKKK